MNANLQKAIDNLHIHDVYLKSSIAQCKNDFEPKYDENLEELNTQTKHIVKETQIVKLNDADLLVRIFIEFGVRLVDSKITNEDESIRALIEAVFIAEYKLDTEIEQVCINEYSLKNSSYHVWPYWREFLMSQCNRMYLPRMVLPTMQLAHNRHQNE